VNTNPFLLPRKQAEGAAATKMTNIAFKKAGAKYANYEQSQAKSVKSGPLIFWYLVLWVKKARRWRKEII
jgi:hypothetical protein